MNLSEAKIKLRKAGAKLIKEDTDDWDEDDLGLDMDRHFEAARHNYFRRSLSTKVADAQAPRMDWENEKEEFLDHLVRYFNAYYREDDDDAKINRDTLRGVCLDDLIEMYRAYKKTGDLDAASEMLLDIIH